MAKFLTDDLLNAELVKLIENAKEQLIIISPFIKLHDRIKDKLKARIEDPDLEITIVYGKEKKGFNENDLKFLKAFPNIEIRFEQRLHAKYYANDDYGLLTSMNLYDFSQNNNIEFGVLTKASSMSSLLKPISGESLDVSAFDYFINVVENSEPIFSREPKYKSGWMGLRSDYTHSETTLDLFTSNERPLEFLDLKKKRGTGFCIRSGEPIRFNPKKPFTQESFIEWAKYSNKDYNENFCHFSGERSNGATSFAFPILKKNYKQAKEIFGF